MSQEKRNDVIADNSTYVRRAIIQNILKDLIKKKYHIHRHLSAIGKFNFSDKE
jgi:hypothetical protein